MTAWDDGYRAGRAGEVGVCLEDPVEDEQYQAGYTAGQYDMNAEAEANGDQGAVDLPPPDGESMTMQEYEHERRRSPQIEDFVDEVRTTNPEEFDLNRFVEPPVD